MQKVLNEKPKITHKKNENTSDLRIFKKEKIFFALNKIGLRLSPKRGRMKIPAKYFKKELFPFILKGLFDTDGCLNIFKNNGVPYPRIEIKICPSPAQNQFIIIVDKLGFKYRVQNLDKGKIRIRISGIKELKKWFEIVGSSNIIHIEKASRFLKEKPL